MSPDTRHLPSMLSRASTGAGAFKYACTFSAGFSRSLLVRNAGGPLTPHDEMESAGDDVVVSQGSGRSSPQCCEARDGSSHSYYYFVSLVY